MAKNSKAETKADSEVSQIPRSLSISKEGIRTGEQFANLMSAVMCDVIEGSMPAETANAVCNAGGKLLKVVEMQYKYSNKPQADGKIIPPPALSLTGQ